MSHVFNRLSQQSRAQSTERKASLEKAGRIYDGANPVQRRLVDSVKAGYRYISARCPRRSGKSFGLTSLCLWLGETRPGSRILIVSLTLKTTKENYWSGAPGGIFVHDQRYGLGLKYNHTDLVWIHENGSRGRLAGAETKADIEYLRGAAAEADIVVIDECKSFAPEHLHELIESAIEPGLMTRNGILVMAGTPGSIPVGAFFEATALTARNEANRPVCVNYNHEGPVRYLDENKIEQVLEPDETKELWRLHTWTLKDNEAVEKRNSQWRRALRNKARAGWSDDHPTWRREYLGEWVTDATDLVYAWVGAKASGKSVTWNPERSRKNPSGLDEADGPWHYVLGLDLGYVDDSAFVLAAWSEKLKELRHVYDFKAPGMTYEDFIDEVLAIIDKYGLPDAIVADTAGGGSKMLIETINQRHGLGIIPAEKRDKMDHIELVNSDFWAGRIKIIPGTDLAIELAGLQWDLERDSKVVLARTNRLHEDPQCPNHLCDALLYLYRYTYHFWSELPVAGPERNSPAWFEAWEQEQIDKAVMKKYAADADPSRLRRWRDGMPWN